MRASWKRAFRFLTPGCPSGLYRSPVRQFLNSSEPDIRAQSTQPISLLYTLPFGVEVSGFSTSSNEIARLVPGIGTTAGGAAGIQYGGLSAGAAKRLHSN